jgi:hypothetical protein
MTENPSTISMGVELWAAETSGLSGGRSDVFDSERGCGVTGSEVHEGRRQTVRCDELVVDGKAPSDISALKPYWGKPAVRDFRGERWKRRHHSKPGPRHRRFPGTFDLLAASVILEGHDATGR